MGFFNEFCCLLIFNWLWRKIEGEFSDFIFCGVLFIVKFLKLINFVKLIVLLNLFLKLLIDLKEEVLFLVFKLFKFVGIFEFWISCDRLFLLVSCFKFDKVLKKFWVVEEVWCIIVLDFKFFLWNNCMFGVLFSFCFSKCLEELWFCLGIGGMLVFFIVLF